MLTVCNAEISSKMFWPKGPKIFGGQKIYAGDQILKLRSQLAPRICVSSAKHRHYEKTLKSSGKCFVYGKLLRHTNKVSLRFLLHDTLHEAFFTGYQEGNIIDNHS